ncbi:sensor histidine kinase [Phenylobacterium sp.]|uniref:sensor histidine kinase n=1 Tax=Phenylobacterium sp. TaxID=1871053 RepID=UPI0027343D37|nr:sensor histidine kinase [Phenylobacterium sp.]MDP3852828.1 sensor histidine kinase [Phenylobacterium sp.]
MAAQTPPYPEGAARSLAMAMVEASPGPLLLLDGDLNIVAASASFCDAFETDAATAPGRPLASLGSGEWNAPQLRSLLDTTASGVAKIEAYEMDLERPGRDTRRLIVHAQRLVYLDLDNLRLLMAVSDVTDARAGEKEKDDALRQNLVLLREVRHRVANSLQIIASVLLQNAKKTRSVETRGHLRDAHNRVMSVAALERQLAGSGEGQVELRAYFTSLCDSIGASMIGDHDQLTLTVTGGGGVVDSKVSVSLGLIVTELVINALKHAFPEGRSGKIQVHCEFHGPNWVLSVSDDGVGMPADPAQLQPGLGTSIVQALAKQLGAVVEISPEHPGTRVAITHTQIALVSGDPDDVADEADIVRPAAGIAGAAI